MKIKGRMIKSLEGTAYLLLAFLAAAWSYFFYLILVCGQIICVESNKTWLFCEFILTSVVAGLGLFLFFRFWRKNRRGEK